MIARRPPSLVILDDMMQAPTKRINVSNDRMGRRLRCITGILSVAVATPEIRSLSTPEAPRQTDSGKSMRFGPCIPPTNANPAKCKLRILRHKGSGTRVHGAER